MNLYTHIGFDDAEQELKWTEEFRKTQAEVGQKKEKTMLQKMFKVCVIWKMGDVFTFLLGCGVFYYFSTKYDKIT